MIKLVTEKVVTASGELGRRITNVKMLTVNELPQEYLTCGEYCYYIPAQKSLYMRYVKDNHFMRTTLLLNTFIGEKDFQFYLMKIRRCGDRLEKINKKVRGSWRGKETFTI